MKTLFARRILACAAAALLLPALIGCGKERGAASSSPSPVSVRLVTPATTGAPVSITPGATPPIVAPAPDADDLVRVIDCVPNVSQRLAYATADNFTGRRIYDFTDAYLR